MTFDDWMLTERPTYQPSDDSMEDRKLRRCWEAAVAAERERCARLVVDVAAEQVKLYAHDPAPVRQPYANNRLMHVGWNAADRIRATTPAAPESA